MNISHEGSSIVTFRGPWPTRNEPEPEPAIASSSDWLDYCRTRERKERAAAKSAGSTQARRIHQQLAQAYAETLRRADGASAE